MSLLLEEESRHSSARNLIGDETPAPASTTKQKAFRRKIGSYREYNAGRTANTIFVYANRMLARFYVCLGLSLIAAAIYILFADWGPGLDREVLLGPSLLIICYGAILSSQALLCLQGLRLMYTRVGVVTGNVLMCIYIFILITTIATEMTALVTGINLQIDLMQTQQNLLKNAAYNGEFTTGESIISTVFNELFFASQLGCSFSITTQTAFFLSWTNTHCPFSISTQQCQKCYHYSASQCAADQLTCSNSYHSSGPACPYAICRLAFLTYALEKYELLLDAGYAFMALQVFHFLMIIVACFHSNCDVHVSDEGTGKPIYKLVDRAEPPMMHQRFAYKVLKLKASPQGRLDERVSEIRELMLMSSV